MSLGPTAKENLIESSKFDRIHHATKKIVVAYFEDPLHYLFYIGLIGLLLLTAFKPEGAPWQYWLVVGGLCAYKVYHYFDKEKSKTK